MALFSEAIKFKFVIFFSFKITAEYLNRYELCPNLDLCLRDLMEDQHLAKAVSRQRVLSNRLFPKSAIYCFDESETIHTFLVAMYVNDSYFACDKIHLLTEWCFESGLFTKWTEDSKHRVHELNFELKKVSLDHILGAFFACSLVLFSAIVTLILELAAFKRARLPNARIIWILLDCFFDDERYEWVPYSNKPSHNQSKLFNIIIFGFVFINIGCVIGFFSILL